MDVESVNSQWEQVETVYKAAKEVWTNQEGYCKL